MFGLGQVQGSPRLQKPTGAQLGRYALKGSWLHKQRPDILLYFEAKTDVCIRNLDFITATAAGSTIGAENRCVY